MSDLIRSTFDPVPLRPALLTADRTGSRREYRLRGGSRERNSCLNHAGACQAGGIIDLHIIELDGAGKRERRITIAVRVFPAGWPGPEHARIMRQVLILHILKLSKHTYFNKNDEREKK